MAPPSTESAGWPTGAGAGAGTSAAAGEGREGVGDKREGGEGEGGEGEGGNCDNREGAGGKGAGGDLVKVQAVGMYPFQWLWRVECYWVRLYTSSRSQLTMQM